MSFGMHRPVVIPKGVRVETQPYSSKISEPILVDDMRPMTKKHVLRVFLYQLLPDLQVMSYPRIVKTGERSAISMMPSMISSSSRKGNPPSVEPILP